MFAKKFARKYQQRLLKLADMLEKDAKKKRGLQFDLDVVGKQSDGREGKKFKPALACGTTGCAMGLAAISGAFKRSAGLSFQVDNKFIETTLHGRHTDYDVAAAEVFDLSMQEANELFNPAHYSNAERYGAEGEREVARRIRAMVARKTK